MKSSAFIQYRLVYYFAQKSDNPQQLRNQCKTTGSLECVHWLAPSSGHVDSVSKHWGALLLILVLSGRVNGTVSQCPRRLPPTFCTAVSILVPSILINFCTCWWHWYLFTGSVPIKTLKDWKVKKVKFSVCLNSVNYIMLTKHTYNPAVFFTYLVFWTDTRRLPLQVWRCCWLTNGSRPAAQWKPPSSWWRSWEPQS